MVEWHTGRARLKLTGHRSTDKVNDVFATSLVDVASVADVTGGAVYIAADNPAWPTDAADVEWLCSVVRVTLASRGIAGIQLSFIPAAGGPSATQSPNT